MERLDLNLLLALDVLLAEGSVLGAARRMKLSSSAMSRTLTRLRAATGDPLLVRAGRALVATPHAAALRDRVGALVKEARAVLRPARDDLDLATLDATFTIRGGRWFIESLGSLLVAAVLEAAPHVRLRFLPKHEKDLRALREGTTFTGPVDESLAMAGLRRTVSVVVPGLPDALRIASATDLLTVVPRSMLGGPLPVDHETRAALRSFALPVPVPELRVVAMWHPRLDADPAHRWLRATVTGCFKELTGSLPT